MKKSICLSALAGFTLTVSSMADAQVFKGGRNRETTKKVTEQATESREARDQRVKAQTQSRETGVQAEALNQKVSLLSGLAKGQTDATQLKSGIKQEYMIQLMEAGSNSTKVLTVKMNDMVERISKENQKIKETNESELTGNNFSVFSSRKALVEITAKLVTVASSKYKGSDADLVLSRDAFARLVETTTKVMDSNSGATARELNEHVRMVTEVVKAKEANDRLTDAEAMMIGAEKAQEAIQAETAQSTGIPAGNESAASKKQRLMEYLKDLKECV